MEYNICKTCGASDGRAGDLIDGECRNCFYTRKRGEVVIYADLKRTDEEIVKTMSILDKLRGKMNKVKYKRYYDRETLERIKRWPQLMNRYCSVRIYSGQWQAFWRNTGQGYTENPNESAIWSFQEAFERTKHCGYEKRIQFIGV